MTNIDRILKSRDITLPTKVHLVKAMVFSSSHVWMWKLDYKESWALKNWCFWTVVLEKTLESPLNCKEIQPISPKRNQSWIFIGRTDAEAETPILWPPDAKNCLIWKDPDAGKDWRQEKGMTEDEIVGWHHWLDGHEFEQALGGGDGQWSLVCCIPWGRKEWNMTEGLNWTEETRPSFQNHTWEKMGNTSGRMCHLIRTLDFNRQQREFLAEGIVGSKQYKAILDTSCWPEVALAWAVALKFFWSSLTVRNRLQLWPIDCVCVCMCVYARASCDINCL